jgi:broad specificity phosphatase PhoE
MLEFDPSMTETDEAWKATSRETINQIRDRIATFLQTLVERPETNVVIVSHGVWIETCFQVFCPEALDYGQKRVNNCNIFAGECVSNKKGEFVRLQNVHQLC